MNQGSDSAKYIRLDGSDQVWGLTYKCASTTLLRALPEPRQYTDLRQGDHVRIIVRDPRDRLLSAWRWFTKYHNCFIKPIMEKDKDAHEAILNANTPFEPWARIALQHWNPHWVPQTEIHPRWREFELVPITALPPGWGKAKVTRSDAEREAWREYYSEGFLELVNELYKEDLVMWKEVEDGIDTGTRRVL